MKTKTTKLNNALLAHKAPEMLDLIKKLIACESRSFDELKVIGEIEKFYRNFEERVNQVNQ